jgi:GTPase involved in cell partitioning and DNA repair
VKGASKGEGLGNQFLGNIREVDAIAHVVRCFDDPDVTHVGNTIDPVADIETIETELMLADLESLEKRVDALEKRIRGQDKEAKETLDLVNRSLALLREGKPARLSSASRRRRSCFTRSACSPRCRCSTYAMSTRRRRDRQRVFARGRERAAEEGAPRRHLGQDRAEIAVLPREEREHFLADIG